MIIKRYLVDNMNEAMVKIRYELGSDAVIVSQRRVRQGGFTGLFKHKKIEVTAAVDDKPKRVSNKEVIDEKQDIQKEFTELKSMLNTLIIEKSAGSNTGNVPAKRDNRSKVKQKLLENDIPQQIVDELYEKIKERNKDKKLTPKGYEKELGILLDEIIKTDTDDGGRIQVLVGPTGVGKTTTIAKLASYYTLYKNKKVGLITIDTYRIGAVEQLKTYAEILGVPIGVVLSSSDIPEVMKKMENCDIIFVDTTGRNSKNIMQVSETRKYVEEFKPDRIHLVLSMTTKQKDIKNIIENYRVVNYNNLILTKFDETDSFGSILTSVYYAGVPISYLTTGQNVPEDIEKADNKKLITFILEAEK